MDNQSKQPLSAAPKAFDVFRPGKQPAPATSRPVIVGHQPQVQDITLTDKPAAMSRHTDERSPSTVPDQAAIEPPADKLTPSASAPEVSEAEEPAFTSETPYDQDMHTAAESAPIAPATEPAPELHIPNLEPQPTDTQPDSPLQPGNEVEQLGAETLAHSGQLADTGQPIISHHRVRRGWIKPLIIALLALALCLLTLDIVLDAGVIKTTTIPHTHFLKRN